MKGVTEHNHGHLLPNRMTLAREDKEAFFNDEDDFEEEKPVEDKEQRCGSAQSVRKDDDNSRPTTPEPLSSSENVC